jgi:hypothetical protein
MNFPGVQCCYNSTRENSYCCRDYCKQNASRPIQINPSHEVQILPVEDSGSGNNLRQWPFNFGWAKGGLCYIFFLICR